MRSNDQRERPILETFRSVFPTIGKLIGCRLSLLPRFGKLLHPHLRLEETGKNGKGVGGVFEGGGVGEGVEEGSGMKYFINPARG